MYGDMITAIVFAIAYLFFIFADTKKNATGAAFNLQEDLGGGYLQVIGQLKIYMRKTGVASILPLVHLESVRQIKNYIQWTSVGCIIISYRTTRLSKIIEKQNYYHYKVEASCSRYG